MFHNPFSVSNVKPGAIPFFFEKSYLLSLKAKDAKRFDRYFYETFSEGDSNTGSWLALQFLADQFEESGFFAQINGPHGAGKSTLMADLERTLKIRGYRVFSFALHDDQRYLPPEFFQKMANCFHSNDCRQDQDQIKNASENPNSADLSSPKAPDWISGQKNIIFLDGYEQLSFCGRWIFSHLCRKSNSGSLISAHRPIMGRPILFQLKPSLEQLRQIVGFLTEDQDILFDTPECSELFDLYKGNIRDVLFALYDEFEDRRALLEYHKKIAAFGNLPPR